MGDWISKNWFELVKCLAIVAGPVLTILGAKLVELRRQERESKRSIYRSLMTYNNGIVGREQVVALNSIDLVFNIKQPEEKDVINSWREYLYHLSTTPRLEKDAAEAEKVAHQQRMEAHSAVNRDLYINLLYIMGVCLRFDFDKVTLRERLYNPQGHADQALQENFIRQNALEILSGRRRLPVEFQMAAKDPEG